MKKILLTVTVFLMFSVLACFAYAEDVPTNEVPPFFQLTPGLSVDTAYLIRAKSFAFGGSVSVAQFIGLVDLRFGYLKTEKEPDNGASKDYYDLALGMELKKAIKALAGECKICETINPTLSIAGAVPTNMDFDKWDVAAMLAVVKVQFTNIPIIE